MEYDISLNLFALTKRLEMAKGKSYPWTEIAERTGLHRSTLERIGRNETNRVDLDTLGKLLGFFRAEGLDIGIGDLFTVLERETRG